MTSRTLRVATWNLHGLRGGIEQIAWVIHTEEIDVLLLQESGPRQRLRELGERLGWIVCADPRAFLRRRIQNAVVIRTSMANLVRPGLVRFDASSLGHPRGALVAAIDEGWTAASVHLGLRGAERGRHVAQLVAMLDGWSDRYVIGADLNALPAEPGPARLAGRATDCWAAVGEGTGATFPSHEPTARIDYLFVGPAVRPLRAWTAGGTVSDHLMVVADLRMDDDL
jgi:endonuclease/exonuclease/phosphatase family metal-dependent hydrolase